MRDRKTAAKTAQKIPSDKIWICIFLSPTKKINPCAVTGGGCERFQLPADACKLTVLSTKTTAACDSDICFQEIFTPSWFGILAAENRDKQQPWQKAVMQQFQHSPTFVHHCQAREGQAACWDQPVPSCHLWHRRSQLLIPFSSPALHIP